jgi:hypothetical protein
MFYSLQICLRVVKLGFQIFCQSLSAHDLIFPRFGLSFFLKEGDSTVAKGKRSSISQKALSIWATKFSFSNLLYSENIYSRLLKFLDNVTFIKLQK